MTDGLADLVGDVAGLVEVVLLDMEDEAVVKDMVLELELAEMLDRTEAEVVELFEVLVVLLDFVVEVLLNLVVTERLGLLDSVLAE